MKIAPDIYCISGKGSDFYVCVGSDGLPDHSTDKTTDFFQLLMTIGTLMTVEILTQIDSIFCDILPKRLQLPPYYKYIWPTLI